MYAIVAYVLATGACSDDGLAPTAAASGGSSSGGSNQPTGSVNTSATVTASGTGDGMGESQGPPGEDSGSTAGLNPTGFASGTDGIDTGFDGSGDSTGRPAGTETEGDSGTSSPRCVATETCTCDPGPVICEALPPMCPPGEVPLVDEMVMCWEGSCVPTEGCFTVPDCTLCEADEACVEAVDLAGEHHTCQEVPPGCMGMPTCECMPAACNAPGFMCVAPVPGGDEDLSCVCPAC